MSQYVEDEKTGNWMLVDDGEGQEYDAETHLENLDDIKAWYEEKSQN